MGTNIVNWATDQTYGLGASGMNVLPTRVAASFIKAKRSRGQFVNACNLNIGNEIVSGPGRTILVPLAQAPAGSSADLTDGAAPTLDDTLTASASLTLNHLYYEAWAMSDVAATITSPVAFEALMAGRMATLLNTVEAATAAYAYSAFSTNSVGTSGTALSYDTLIAARAKLTDSYAPADGDIAGFLDGTTYGTALKDSTIKAAQNQGSVQNLAPAATGMGLGASINRPFVWAGGIPFYESQSIPTASVGTHTERRNLVFHRDALLFASRGIGEGVIPGVGAPWVKHIVVDGMVITLKIAYDPTYLSQRLHVMIMCGFIVGREDWGCVVLD